MREGGPTGARQPDRLEQLNWLEIRAGAARKGQTLKDLQQGSLCMQKLAPAGVGTGLQAGKK